MRSMKVEFYTTKKESLMKKRRSSYSINEFILNRWSPRAMTGQEISDEQLMTLFEAARWAPSSYNNQPWRFIYAKKNSEGWDRLYNLLASGNKIWAKNAAVLVVVLSKNNFDYNNKPSRTHSFDAGAAWQNLALQGSIEGLVVHGMEGFNYGQAKTDLNIPDDYTVEAMVAIGVYGNLENLPEELQKVDFPSDRKPLQEIIFENLFTDNVKKNID